MAGLASLSQAYTAMGTKGYKIQVFADPKDFGCNKYKRIFKKI